VCRGGVGAIGSGDSGDGQVLGKDVGGDVWYVDGELGVWQPVKPPRVVGLAGRCSARLSARLSTNRLCRSGLRNVSRGVVILLVVIGIHPDGIVLAVGRLRHDLVQGWNRRFRTSPSRAQRSSGSPLSFVMNTSNATSFARAWVNMLTSVVPEAMMRIARAWSICPGRMKRPIA